ncbi:hypothetical protein Q9L58_006261 [Maublancomyces gigas]|uniref:Uncharacterized protein n=1 Tax=Discina gigas TaxID=1032678 RepID=A0ABR3GFU5_9PEZI
MPKEHSPRPPAPQINQRLVDLISDSRKRLLHLLRTEQSGTPSMANVALGLETMKTIGDTIKKLVENEGAVVEKERLRAETKEIQVKTEKLVSEKERLWEEMKRIQAKMQNTNAGRA